MFETTLFLDSTFGPERNLNPTNTMNRLNLQKIAAATAIACEEAGGQISVFQLMKILYLSDRQTLISFERTITGDSYSSMPKGPILSETYNFVRNKSGLTTLQNIWNTMFSKNGNDLTPICEIDRSDLAPVQEQIIREKTKLVLKIMNSGKSLADWMHKNCPEWEDVPQGSSKTLPLGRVIKFALNVDATVAGQIRDEIEAVNRRPSSALAKACA